MNDRSRWTRYPESLDEQPLSAEPTRQEERQPADTSPLLANRARVLMVVFLAFMGLVVVRLVDMQLLGGGGPLVPVAKASQPLRGRIVDRNGILLATDDFVGKVYARPAGIAEATIGESLVISLTEKLELPIETVRAALATDETLAVVANGVPARQCDAVNELGERVLVWCDASRVRSYPQGSLASHVVGFTNYQHQGVHGVEANYDAWLRTDAVWPADHLPGQAQPLPEDWKLYLPSPAGHDLVLHLDAALQYMVEMRLGNAVKHNWADGGSVIVMDPRTGAILASANDPTFDPNHYSEVEPDLWVNAAVSEIYEPGSVMKLVTMAAGLDAGKITPETYFPDPGALTLNGRTIHNAMGHAYGTVTVREALARSINVITAQIALQVGPEAFYSYLRKFGFGEHSEVDLNGEEPGIVKQPGADGWVEFDMAVNSFGQAMSCTTLQMTNAVAAIANGGTLYQPQVVSGFVENGEVHQLPTRVMNRPISSEAARQMASMMTFTVDVSSDPKPVPGFKVAGKTGTAEIPTAEGYTSEDTITSFVGFLPAADPQLVIMVKLVRPRRERWAEYVAMPLWAEIARDAVQILDIKPNDEEP